VQKNQPNDTLSQIELSQAWFKLCDADVLFVFTLALFSVVGAERVVSANLISLQSAISALLEINAGELLAIIAIYSVLKSNRTTIVLTKVDLTTVSACAIFFLLPERHLPFLGSTLAGVYLWRRYRRDDPLASVGQLWVAISAHEVWGPLFFKIVSAPIIKMEVVVIAMVGQLLGFGLSVDGVILRSPTGWGVFMMEACSSFHNVSLAVLVWLSLLKLSAAAISRPNLVALGVGVCAIICLNVLRILFMTRSAEAYHYWHEGSGALIFSCLALAAVALPTMISVRQKG
jgi:hypothetical protein